MLNKKIVPDIQGEMDELQRVSQDLKRDEGIILSVDELIELFKNSKQQTLSDEIWKKLENTESNEIEKGDWDSVFTVAKSYKKTNPKKLKKIIESGDYERPLILKIDDRYILVAGNTRLSTAAAMGINPKVFIGEVDVEVIGRKLINKAHTDITRTKGKDYSPDHNEIQKWIDDIRKKSKVNEIEKLKGGLADNKTITQISKKHTTNNNQIDDMVKSLKSQFNMGIKVEMEHTNDKEMAKEIALDHLWEDPFYYSKLRKMETKESMGADSSGSFSGPLMNRPPIKKKHSIQHNSKKYNMLEQDEEFVEATTASSSGSYDVPLFGGTKGRKNPLKISGEKSIKSSRAVKDKNFPKYGGSKGVFIKIKEKCKKFPYCNQGDINAIELLEIKELNEAIKEISNEFGIPIKEIEKIVLKEIKQIFI
jgi:hypothetical protein